MTEDGNVVVAQLDRAELALHRAAVGVIADVRTALTPVQIEHVVTSGDVESWVVHATRAAGRLASQWRASYLAGGHAVAVAADRLARQVEKAPWFDPSTDRAVQAMRQNTLRLISEVSDDARTVIRSEIIDGLANGVNPREVARRLREVVGLTARQWEAVRNYRRLLNGLDREGLERALRDKRTDRMLREAIRAGKPLTRQQVERMVRSYVDNYVRLRAETIARTESLRSIHEAADEAWTQAALAGEVNPERVVRTWQVRIDGRQRDSHKAMSGQKRLLGRPFKTGAGYDIRYPGDPRAPASETVNCRCTLSTRVK